MDRFRRLNAALNDCPGWQRILLGLVGFLVSTTIWHPRLHGGPWPWMGLPLILLAVILGGSLLLIGLNRRRR